MESQLPTSVAPEKIETSTNETERNRQMTTIFSLGEDELNLIIDELCFEDRLNLRDAFPFSFISYVVTNNLSTQNCLYLNMDTTQERGKTYFTHGMEATLNNDHKVPLLHPGALGTSNLSAKNEAKYTLEHDTIVHMSTKTLAQTFANLKTLKISMEDPTLQSLSKVANILIAFSDHRDLTCLQLFLCAEMYYLLNKQILFQKRQIHAEFAYLISILNRSAAYSNLKNLVLHIGSAYFSDSDKPGSHSNKLPADPSSLTLRLLSTVENAYLKLPHEAVIANYDLLASNFNLQTLGLCVRPTLFCTILEKIQQEEENAQNTEGKSAKLARKIVHLLEHQKILVDFSILENRLTLFVAHFTSLTHFHCSLKVDEFLKMLTALQTLTSLREVNFHVFYPKEDDTEDTLTSLLDAQHRLYGYDVHMPKVLSLSLSIDGSNSLFTNSRLFQQLALERAFSNIHFFRLQLEHFRNNNGNFRSISSSLENTKDVIWKLFKPVIGQLAYLHWCKVGVCFTTENKLRNFEINVKRKDTFKIINEDENMEWSFNLKLN